MTQAKSIYPERVLQEIDKDVKVKAPDTRHTIILGDSRYMEEVTDSSVHLVVTSPPYPMIEIWDEFFKDAGCTTYDQMHEYLAETWREVYRVLIKGGIACINIGDATRTVNGIYRLYPNHSRIIEVCEEIGFTSLPNILWMKPTTKPNAFLGSGFLPPNAYITLDCEYILIFRKGDVRRFEPKDPFRYASHFTREERDLWFSQVWNIKGIKQQCDSLERRIAVFPDEIAYRLIRMFSIIGDVILDPFLGTGTTTRIAIQLHRNSVGYEIDDELSKIIKKRIDQKDLGQNDRTVVEFKRGNHEK